MKRVWVKRIDDIGDDRTMFAVGLKIGAIALAAAMVFLEARIIEAWILG